MEEMSNTFDDNIVESVSPNKDIVIAKKVKQSIAEIIPLYEVRLYGSRARGDASADSDLDLYLETGPISREQRRLISDLVWGIGFENDVVISPLVIPQSEARNGAFSVSIICQAIKNEGISI